MQKKIKIRLRELRGPRSQARFAADLGIPQQTYANYETGRSEVGLALLCELSSRFGVSADWLLGLRENAKPAAQIVASGKNSQAAGRDILAGPSAETTAEVERLRGEVAALERALAMFAPKKGGKR